MSIGVYKLKKTSALYCGYYTIIKTHGFDLFNTPCLVYIICRNRQAAWLLVLVDLQRTHYRENSEMVSKSADLERNLI